MIVSPPAPSSAMRTQTGSREAMPAARRPGSPPPWRARHLLAGPPAAAVADGPGQLAGTGGTMMAPSERVSRGVASSREWSSTVREEGGPADQRVLPEELVRLLR